VFFLQNHDQIGNRAFGDRLTGIAKPEALEAAIALQLLCPQIPLLFMGEEEASVSPFQFFTDHHGELADAVREGRRKEFASFASFSDPARRAQIPDPNDAATFERSRAEAGEGANARRDLYRRLLALRATHLVPFLKGTKATGARAIGPSAVQAQWRLANGALWTLACNLGADPCALELPVGEAIYGAPTGFALAPFTTIAILERARG
jgi:maltooligosyltrehalose trehalohydrolase